MVLVPPVAGGDDAGRREEGERVEVGVPHEALPVGRRQRVHVARDVAPHVEGGPEDLGQATKHNTHKRLRCRVRFRAIARWVVTAMMIMMTMTLGVVVDVVGTVAVLIDVTGVVRVLLSWWRHALLAFCAAAVTPPGPTKKQCRCTPDLVYFLDSSIPRVGFSTTSGPNLIR